MLNRLLLGSSANSKLRHRPARGRDPSVMWGVLMGQALYGLDLKAFDEDEKAAPDRRPLRLKVASFRPRRGREIIYRVEVQSAAPA